MKLLLPRYSQYNLKAERFFALTLEFLPLVGTA
jgi:hypothetical protein